MCLIISRGNMTPWENRRNFQTYYPPFDVRAKADLFETFFYKHHTASFYSPAVGKNGHKSGFCL